MTRPTHNPGQQTERPWWHKVWHGAAGWTVTDARGKRVQLWPYVVPPRGLRERVGMKDDEVATLKRWLVHDRLIHAAAVAGLNYAMWRVLIEIWLGRNPRLTLGSLPVTMLPILIALGFFVFDWRKVIARSRERHQAALLLVRRCASCGYSIKGLPSQDDGCTVCPECGAAWKLPEGGSA
ncbi:MAG: hypothetical protein H6812_04170 [Phycisphaeraceae bacterium]|nr:hypothetical protein [Phycisphaeraceae bacterium]